MPALLQFDVANSEEENECYQFIVRKISGMATEEDLVMENINTQNLEVASPRRKTSLSVSNLEEVLRSNELERIGREKDEKETKRRFKQVVRTLEGSWEREKATLVTCRLHTLLLMKHALLSYSYVSLQN